MKIRETPLKVLGPIGDQSDIDAIGEVIESGWWGKGPKVEEFEQEFAKLVGAKHAISVTSNSHGQDLVMKAMGFKGIDVINPTISFVATAQIPLWNDCTTNIVDVDSINMNITAEQVEKYKKPNSEVCIAVNMAGIPAPIDEIRKVFGGYIIEDCAHSPLVKINHKYVGTYGDAAILSFFPTKPIPAGEGGMIIIKDRNIANEIRKIRDYGKFKDANGATKHILPAFPNARLNEYSATVANTILKNYTDLLRFKTKIANYYNSRIDNELIFSKIYSDEIITEFSYYKYITFFKESKYKTAQVYDSDNQLISILKDNSLKYKFFGEDEFARDHICLPITYSMSTDDAQMILDNTF